MILSRQVMGLLQALAWFTMAGPAKLSRMFVTAWAGSGKESFGRRIQATSFLENGSKLYANVLLA